MHWLAVLIWTAYVAVVFLLVRRRLSARRALSPALDVDGEALPSLSIIIPARDEAGNISGCLKSILGQNYPAHLLEIIVVDDNSTDETVEIVKRAQSLSTNIGLVSAPKLPDGWLGKPHACWLGAAQAQGDWLCFIDADVRLHPNLLTSALVDALQNRAEFLSLHPHQEMRTFGERFLMPPAFMGLLILMDFERINDPDSRAAMANGQFILARRDRYFDFGGHRSVKDKVLEDVELARQAKRSGLPIRLLTGGELIHTRMYSSVSAVWQGLTRGVVDIAGGPLFASATIGSTILVAWLPLILPVWLLFSSAIPAVAQTAALALVVLTSALWYASLGMILRWYRVPLRYLLLLPLSFTAVSLATAEGVLRYLTRSRMWKGRRL
jgi:chlorobactene glucosyltransferase